MCVLKSTVCGISAHVNSMLFNTNGFYTSALSPQTYHPRRRPHYSPCFKCRQGRVPYNTFAISRALRARLFACEMLHNKPLHV
jgi:hypothetical protein